MFYGQARHTIDAKGRIILPSKYRDSLGESFFVMRGREKQACLYIYSTDGFNEFKEKIKAIPDANGGSAFKRFIFNNTEEVVNDKQGRFVIPTRLKEYANLEKEIMIVGTDDRIEIWDASVYEGTETQFTNDNVVEFMEKYGI